MDTKDAKLPEHIAVIVDGNRRYAKKLLKKPWEIFMKGYDWGAQTLENFFYWCYEFGIKELTIYCFSIENFKRSKIEFECILQIVKKYLKKLDKHPKINEIKVNFVGRTDLFPASIQKIMKDISDKTKNNKPHIVNFAMGYGGRTEIIDASKKLAKKVQEGKLKIEDIDEKAFESCLYMKSEPDLIIRTSESRLSGFLLYQGAYSELIFLKDLLWPEFKKEHFIECLEEYSRRKRRFGK